MTRTFIIITSVSVLAICLVFVMNHWDQKSRGDSVSRKVLFVSRSKSPSPTSPPSPSPSPPASSDSFSDSFSPSQSDVLDYFDARTGDADSTSFDFSPTGQVGSEDQFSPLNNSEIEIKTVERRFNSTTSQQGLNNEKTRIDKSMEDKGKKGEEGEVMSCRQTDAKFLAAAPPNKRRQKIAFISYPRCGNSMTRVLLERLTGVWTGTVSDPEKDHILRGYGFRGQGIRNDTVMIVKSHEYIPSFKRLQPWDKIIYLFRNPFDSFLSRLNKQLSNSHNTTIQFSQEQLEHRTPRYYHEWLGHVRFFIGQLTPASEIELPDGRHIPVLLVRYEDLVSKEPQCFLFKDSRICDTRKMYQLARIAHFIETSDVLPLELFLTTPWPFSSPPKPLMTIITFKRFKKNFGNDPEEDTDNERKTNLKVINSEFITSPPPLTLERLQCVNLPEANAGYTPRAKEDAPAIEAYSKEMRKFLIDEMSKELCALGYQRQSPSLSLNCDGIREGIREDLLTLLWTSVSPLYQEN